MQVFQNSTNDNTLQSNPLEAKLPISEDFINKDEFEFKSINLSQKSLKVLNRLSYIAAAFSLYQFIYSTASLVYLHSAFNSDSAWTSLASLIISVMLITWSSIMLRAEENRALFSHDVTGGRWEVLYQAGFTIIMFRIASSLPMIANIFFQGNATIHHLNSNEENEGFLSAETMRNLSLPLPFIEILLLGFFVQAARIVFGYIKEKSSAISRMIFLGNLVLMGSGLGLIFYNRAIENSVFAENYIGNLGVIGAVIAAFTGLIWLVNHGKWRVPYMATTVLVAGLVVSLGALSVYSFQKTHQIEKSNEEIGFLNSGDFLAVSNFSLMGTMSGLMILLGLAYFWRSNFQDTGFRSKQNYKWLGGLGLVLVAFLAINGMDFKNKLETRSFFLPSNELPFENSMILATDGSDYGNIWEALRVKSYRFILFKRSWDDPSNPMRLKIEGGPWSWGYSDFYNSIESQANQVAFYWAGPQGQEQLVLVIYNPSSLGKTPEKVLSEYQLPTDPKNLQKFGITIAKTLAVTDKARITNAELNNLPPPPSSSTPVAPTSSPDGSMYNVLWTAIKNKQNRLFVFAKDPKDPSKITVQQGNWNAVFGDFVNAFQPNQEQVGFYVMGDSNPALYEVVMAPTTVKLSPAQIVTNFGLPTDPKVLQKFGLPLATTLTVKQKSEITMTNLIMSGVGGGVISLFDFSSVLPDEDGSGYTELWDDLKAQKYRFAVFRKDLTNPLKVVTELGQWETTFDNFAAFFDESLPTVGFIWLGNPQKEKLYQVIYVPSKLKLTAAQIVTMYGLPKKASVYQEKYGLPAVNWFVAYSKNDITIFRTTYWSRTQGTVSFIADQDFNSEFPFENSLVLADGSDYGNVWRALRDKAYQFIVFKKTWNDPSNPNQIRLEGGPWTWSFDQFFASIEPQANQVAFIYVGAQQQLVLVIYAPTSLGRTQAQVLDSYNLPTNPQDLEVYGLRVAKTVVVTDRNAITLKNLEVAGVPGTSTTTTTTTTTTTNPPATATSSADGSTYAELWRAFNNKQNRFFVFSRDPKDRTKISVQPGSWNAVFFNFAEAFKPDQEQVGFYLMDSSSGSQLYEVVYAPAQSGLSAAQIVSNFGLPTNPSILKQNFGVPLPMTYIAKTKADIDLTKVIMGAKSGGIVTMIADDSFALDKLSFLADFPTLATNDGSTYAELWSDVKSKAYKFFVFKRDSQDPLKIDVEIGSWEHTFEDFNDSFDDKVPQTGFIWIGNPGKEKLYQVVYVPSQSGLNAAQVVASYGLPLNTALYQQKYGLPDINWFVAYSKKEIEQSKTLMWSHNKGTISMIADIDVPEVELPFESAMILADGSDYGNVWRALRDKAYQFIVFKKTWNDPSNPNQIRLEGGPWTWSFDQFLASIEPQANQVAFIYSGASQQLVLVVYNPSSLGRTPAQVLDSYNLPTNPQDLEVYGLRIAKTVYVNDRNAITLKSIDVGGAPAAATTTTTTTTTTPAATASSNGPDGSTYVELWRAFNNKQNRFFVFSRDPKDRTKISVQPGSWNAVFFNFAEAFKQDQEAVGFYLMDSSSGSQLYEVVYAPASVGLSASQILTNFGLPTNPSVLKQNFGVPLPMTYIAKVKTDIDLTKVIMGAKSGGIVTMIADDNSSPYGKVWEALRDRSYRFIIFKRDWTNPANPNRLRVEGGPWDMTFEDFYASVEPQANQVAFVYVGPEGQETLVRAVINPTSLGKTAAQVLNDYQIPVDAAQLERFGLSIAKTLEFNDKKNVELGRFVDKPADGSAYAELWEQLQNHEFRFLVFGRNETDPKKIVVQPGRWNALFYDFVDSFKPNQEQVGYYLVSSVSGGNQLYQVVLAPPQSHNFPGQILANYGLPSDPAVLQQKFDLPLGHTFIAKQKRDIDLETILKHSNVGGIVNLL